MSEQAPDDLIYAPERFFVPGSLEEAKQIICTPEAGLAPEERWQLETKWIMQYLDFDPLDMVLDYGCGVGRIARELPCSVLGVDISLSMRVWAETYVSRAQFGVINPVMLQMLIRKGFRADAALAIWVLQHCYDLEYDVRLIAAAIPKAGTLTMINRMHRAVPARRQNIPDDSTGWLDDGLKVEDFLTNFFHLDNCVPLPEELCAPGALLSTWIRTGVSADLAAPRTQERQFAKEVRA